MKVFICPECGSTYFGSGNLRGKDGLGVPPSQVTIYCHDQHGVGCKWSGKWADMPDRDEEDS